VSQASKRILLVDDSELMLEMAMSALRDQGYAVEIARNLGELEQQRQSGHFDLVLMDVQMPEAFGDDVAAVLRDVRGMDTPIYLLSSLDDEELRRRASEAGVEGFIPKREGMANLVRRVKGILP
jgi:DNA-binding response OmpR family regulator